MDEKTYHQNLRKYSKAIKLAIKVSKLSAGRQVENIKVWACLLFTKMCVTGTSIWILAPESEIAKKELPHWDFSSLFSLTRNLMECYQTMFYLTIDNISDDERDARKNLFDLHDYFSRKKLFSFSQEATENIDIENSVINKLLENKYFQSLDEKQQKHYLRGENAFFITREEIEERIGSDKNEFKLIYKLLSSNTHSFPMGFYGMLEGKRGTGVKSEVEIGYCNLSLDITQQYITLATKNIIEFFPDILNKLSKNEQNFLE